MKMTKGHPNDMAIARRNQSLRIDAGLHPSHLRENILIAFSVTRHHYGGTEQPRIEW